QSEPGLLKPAYQILLYHNTQNPTLRLNHVVQMNDYNLQLHYTAVENFLKNKRKLCGWYFPDLVDQKISGNSVEWLYEKTDPVLPNSILNRFLLHKDRAGYPIEQ